MDTESLPSLRLPSNRQFVSLSEAVSWIAFHYSMESGELAAFLGRSEFIANGAASEDRTSSWRADAAKTERVRSAIELLADKARGELIELQGKFLPDVLKDTRQLLKRPIKPSHLANFARFDPLDDSLLRGRGVSWGEDLRVIEQPDDDRHFRWVEVRRDDLLEHFPVPRKPSVTSTAAAEVECKEWLRDQFESDPKNRQTKLNLQKDAIAQSSGRLSARGFQRAWSDVAPDYGRDRGGRKRKR